MPAKAYSLLAALLLLSASTLPAQEEESSKPRRAPRPNPMVRKHKAKAPVGKPVDINSASKEALMTLKGVTEADALRIIQGRPYLTKANLITKQVLPMTIYEPIKHQLFVDQHLQPAPKRR